MYYPAFGNPATIRLAEKYNCEWLQDVTTPPNIIQRTSTMNENDELSHSRIFHKNQSIGDDDEFVITFRNLQPTYSCPDLYSSFRREQLRERSYSLTTLDAYARLDITRDTLEQMWLSLLDLAFSDKDDRELGESKLHHIMSLSNSYTNMNETLVEKSRSHGDIFSTTNKTEKLNTKKSKSFDTTSLPKPSATDHSANVGLLQGAAISEPFVDRVCSTSAHSDTEPNLIDMDDDSIHSLEQENPFPEEDHLSNDEKISPVIKEPLDYVFRYPHQLRSHSDDDYDFDQTPDITNYLPQSINTMNQNFGEEDRQLYMSLGFDDDDEAPAVFPPVIDQRPAHEKLAEYRPHSLSTIPSSRASQYASSEGESDDNIDEENKLRRNTISDNQEIFSESEHSEKQDEEDSLSEHSEKQLEDLAQSEHSEKQEEEEKSISEHSEKPEEEEEDLSSEHSFNLEDPKADEPNPYVDRRPVPDILADHRPHSLSTIRSSGASQYEEEDEEEEYKNIRRSTISNNPDQYSDQEDEVLDIESNPFLTPSILHPQKPVRKITFTLQMFLLVIN